MARVQNGADHDWTYQVKNIWATFFYVYVYLFLKSSLFKKQSEVIYTDLKKGK